MKKTESGAETSITNVSGASFQKPSERIFYFAPSNRMRPLAQRLRGQSYTWSFLGLDTAGRRRAAAVFDPSREYRLNDEHNEAARAVRDEYLIWIDRIARAQPDPLNWWSSAVSSKSPWQSDFFFKVVYIELVRQWMARGSGSHVIILENPWLYETLFNNLNGSPGALFETSPAHAIWRVRLAWRTRAFVGSLAFLLRTATMSALSKLWLRPKPIPQTTAETWLFTWLDDRGLTGSDYHDLYTGRLAAILRAGGMSVKRLILPRLSFSQLFGLRKHSDEFIVSIAEAKLTDVIRSALCGLRVQDITPIATFRGVDYTPLFREEARRGAGTMEFSMLQLWYRTLCRIAPRYAQGVRNVIYPFENQPFEKLMVAAWKRYAPSVNLIAYQHSTYGRYYLSYFLAAGEAQYLPMPDWIVASGDLTFKLLQEGNWPQERLLKGGSLRYEYLFDPAPRDNERTSDPAAVLVVFPSSRAYSKVLLNDLCEIYGKSSPIESAKPVQFILKCHSGAPLHKLLERGDALPPGFVSTDAPIRDLLPQINACLYLGPTTVCFETIWLGIPTVKYRSDLLDLDIAEVQPGLPIITATKSNLRSVLEKALAQPVHVSPENREMLQSVFSPVTERTWIDLVKGAA
jgi:hypothetical protein